MKRLFWICFGGFAQIAFTLIVPLIFLWLYQNGGDLLGIGQAALPNERLLPLFWAIVLDMALLLQFAIPHSYLLLPSTRDHFEKWIPSELYGSFFALVASVSLLLCWWLWQPLPGVIYETSGPLAWILLGAFLGSWVMLIYSISLTGLGWQTGFTPWLRYTLGQPMPRRRFVTDNLYRWLRHPVYLGFLGLIWFTPRMTSDYLLRAVVWTTYVYVGSVLKDQRLEFFIGERYRTYMRRVRGYPLLFWGPLGRLPAEPTKETAQQEIPSQAVASS